MKPDPQQPAAQTQTASPLDQAIAATLPAAQNEGAARARELAPRIVTGLHRSADPVQFATAMIVAANELTKECDPNSVAKAAFACAQLGLLPGSALGLAFFVPFWNKDRGVNLCQLVIGYRGFLDLAYDNDFLKDVHSDVVLRGEEFKHWTDTNGPQVNHDFPDPLTRELEKPNVVGAYGIYHTRNGGHGICVLNRKQLDKVDTGKNVWQFDPISMYLKSPIRRMAKRWKITPRMAYAVNWDEQAERGAPQTLPNLDAAVAETTKRLTLAKVRGDEPEPEAPVDEPKPPTPLEREKAAIDNADSPEEIDQVISSAIAHGTLVGDDLAALREHGKARFDAEATT